MFNPFVIKKWAALMLCALLSVVMFFIGLVYYNLIGGIGFMIAGLLLGALLGNMFLKNPFSSMLEGKGILAINLDSTGILQPFIVKVQSPYIKGKLNAHEVNDVFDREAVYQLAVPQNATEQAVMKDGILSMRLDTQAFNRARFAMFHYPVLIYNEQLKSVLTKDFLADIEKDSFAEHGVLYLNRKVEELSSHIRDFGRYVVETLKPKDGGIFGSKWVWIIIVVALGILAALFAPSIIGALKGTASTATAAVGNAAAATQTITPVT